MAKPKTSCTWAVKAAQVIITGAALLTAGCGDNRAPTSAPPDPWKLVSVADTVRLKPGATAAVSFLLTTKDGAPLGGERLDFAAVDDPLTPQNELAGATLSASSALTDGDGIGSVTVTGGLETVFPLTAHNPRTQVATAIIMVGNGDRGTVAVIAQPATGSATGSAIASVDLLFFDSRFCSELSAVMPPVPVRPTRKVAAGTPAEFMINSDESAVVGQGRDGSGTMQAVGCVDIPASTVVSGSTVRVYLPLSALVPVPEGTYLLSSRFSLAKRDLGPLMAAPWKDLGDCPLDPAQLWLDCAIDALGSPTGDTLDCVPAPTGEGVLADLIGSHRGNASAGSPCRAPTLPGGAQSLDAKVAALFPSPAQPPVSDIDALAASIATILDNVTLTSTLSLQPSASPGIFQATHTLRTASFQVGTRSVPVDVVAQGVPSAAVRFVPVTTMGSLLAVGAHGLGLRLGTLAHVAFASVALLGRGLPSASDAYLDVLLGSATTAPGPAHRTGCDALDALVCADVGLGPGCLRAACVAGQAALAERLDAAFKLADGDGTDLQLFGSAGMLDSDANGVADQLGTTAAGSGLWTAQIRAHAGTEIMSGSWTGSLQAP